MDTLQIIIELESLDLFLIRVYILCGFFCMGYEFREFIGTPSWGHVAKCIIKPLVWPLALFIGFKRLLEEYDIISRRP